MAKAPVLRKGLTVEDVIKDSWLDKADRGEFEVGDRLGQRIARKAARAAVVAFVEAVNKEERVTKGELMFFFTQLSDIAREIGRVAKARIDRGELQPTLLDKLVQ
jgi:hypothetical protein